MFCKNCGNQLRDDAAFCPKCGTKTRIQEISEKQEKVEVPKPQVQKPKKKTGAAILVTIFIVIIGAGISAGMLFFKGKGEADGLEQSSGRQEKDAEEKESGVSGIEDENTSESVQEEETDYAVNAEDVYAVFGVTKGIAEDYAANLDTNSYQYYNSGVSDFHFFYPTDLYGEIRYSDEETDSDYGTNITTIDFVGSEGSELLFSLTKYQGASIEKMSETVYNTEKAGIVDAADVIYGVDEDHGRIIVTGFNEEGSKLVYDLTKVDAEYVMQMKIIFPAYQGNEDKFQKDYVTECLYRLCGFSGSTANCRSYDKYKEECLDLEAEIEKIQERYYATQDELDSMEIMTVNGTTAYSKDESIRKIVVAKGTDGIDYAREYYYADGKLYFAFLYNESRENRLYFVNNMLVRYIDEEADIYDIEEADSYMDFAFEFRDEAYRILGGM